MDPKFDDLLSTLIGLLHYKCDRYDPEWPDLYTRVVAHSMLHAFEELGLAERIKEDGQTIWRATQELKSLAARAGIERSHG